MDSNFIIILDNKDSDILKLFDSNKFYKVNNEIGVNSKDFIAIASERYTKNYGFIHEILERSQMVWNAEPSKPRDPELEARVEKLRGEQSDKEYRNMVKWLLPLDGYNIALREDVTSLKAQVTAVVNFVLCVGGSFFFSYKAVEYTLPEPSIPLQVLVGIITAVVVAIADLYFLLRTI